MDNTVKIWSMKGKAFSFLWPAIIPLVAFVYPDISYSSVLEFHRIFHIVIMDGTIVLER